MPSRWTGLWMVAAGLAGACGLDRSLGADRAVSVVPMQPAIETPAAPLSGTHAIPTQPGAGASASPPPSTAPDLDQTGPDNPAGLSATEAAALVAGGPLGEMRWLYPYDGTVFPGGSIAPLVMWTGNAAPDAVYLHIQSSQFEYKGVLKPSFEGGLFIPAQNALAGVLNDSSWQRTRQPQKQVVIPQPVWNAAVARTQGSRDPFVISVSERVNGQVHGPVSARIIIARGSVQGSIYYNSCYAGSSSTTVDPGLGVQGIGARVMRIPPRGNAEVVSDSVQCIGCHSVSANGARLVAQRAFAVADTQMRAMNPGLPADHYTYALSLPLLHDGAPDLGASAHIGMMGSYGALYPDGSKYLAPSGRIDAGYLSHAEELQRPAAAVLVDTITGAQVPGAGVPADAAMPMFAPDGKRLVFNDASTGGHRIAVMDYDVQNHQASAYRALVETDGSNALRPGWPAFLPDGKAVIFVQTDSENFSSHLTIAPNAVPAKSDLYIVDVESGKATLLARAMGFETLEAANAVTSPFMGEDRHRNHFPTVSPAAAGGYFWLFFDSVRDFGSMGPMRTLWGAAIDIHPDGRYTTDPSHPPFYVPGQEFLNTGHFRAFAALDRCSPDGEACASGIDCCGGACSELGVCGPPGNSCAKRQERCAETADCCDSADYCINGFCSLVELL